MNGQDWMAYIPMYVVAALILWRLDRLGKQLEAVRDLLLLELGNEETKSDVLQQREWEKKERKKEARQFWIFWAIVSLAGIIWYMVTHH
jgi:hypothetical protein